MKRRAVFFALGCSAAAVSALALRPTQRAAETLPPIELQKQVPKSFSGWQIDNSIVPILPDPSVQAKLNEIYNQVLARTYVDGRGQRVMLSIAYGADQASDSTAVHRPEFCYSAQGFVVRDLGVETLTVSAKELRVRRLMGSIGARQEPITYWVTLNDQAVMPGVQRKLQQIRLGLSGQIPDGLLFRVSTIGADTKAGFETQQRFIVDLASAMPEPVRSRYFGRA